MPSVISGDANVSATEFGYLDGVTSALQTQLDAKLATATASSTYLPIAGGKILQIVRATDSTQRTTTSTSYVDVTGMSVTITPQKSDSAVIVMANFNAYTVTAGVARFQIADASNNGISGSEESRLGTGSGEVGAYFSLIAYATPATTSAVTYKLRMRREGAGTVRLDNNLSTGQMYAIEVSA